MILNFCLVLWNLKITEKETLRSFCFRPLFLQPDLTFERGLGTEDCDLEQGSKTVSIGGGGQVYLISVYKYSNTGINRTAENRKVTSIKIEIRRTYNYQGDKRDFLKGNNSNKRNVNLV